MLLDPWWSAALVGLFGLMIGSFLNVVIYRLPKMMERQWDAEVAAYAAERAARQTTSATTAELAAVLPPVSEPFNPEPFNLLVPRSRCQACGHMVQWYENIPVLSYLVLRGKCSSCGVNISVRYPLVELSTAGLFAFLGHWGGLSLPTLIWCGFAAAMVTLAMIDWDTTLLPDDITLPLLWTGLLASTLGWTGVPAATSVVGAAAGYLSLWIVYWGFKLATGKEGMGYGDFKLFAVLGAWYGWQALLPIILMASIVGAIVGLVMKFRNRLREGGYVPFGPFLVGAGLVSMVFTPESIMQAVLGLLGL
ncbi:leader peptidase (prepilin peptidase)/N-methyltransferase [Acidovorax soli]|uniref:Prepilin leader peptidase/N-methyltransferase n=1 Tax=Acidovorax soli TaxID=592050 RepID=A0A7X0PG50_9BURK|nr:A24 family peptidase [Acidovorax soli]MBB6561129.1 leader peptidase (prepilin peptidase)/N-methyltransferase [Acidovorax soli]